MSDLEKETVTEQQQHLTESNHDSNQAVEDLTEVDKVGKKGVFFFIETSRLKFFLFFLKCRN